MPACQGGTSQRSKCEEVILTPWRGAPVLSCQEGRVLIVSRRPRSSGKLSSAANANGRLWPCTWCGERDTNANTASWPELHVGQASQLAMGHGQVSPSGAGDGRGQPPGALLRAIKPGAVLQGPVRRPPRVCRGAQVDNPAARTLMRRQPSFATLASWNRCPEDCQGE